MAGACTNQFDTGFVALGYGKVAVLGVVQGITELMPISSTAHMRIVPALLGWQDVRGLIFGSIYSIRRRNFRSWDFRFAVWIVLATIPIVIAGIVLSPVLN